MYISTLLKRNKNLNISFKQLVFECASNYMYLSHSLLSSDVENALEYKYKAECLLEILEIIVCGSIGGFDSGQSSNEFGRVEQRKYTHDFDRLLWIWERYTDLNEYKNYSKYIKELKNYYSRGDK